MEERQDSLDLLLSCVVCLEDFEEDGEKTPRLLPCTHTLCQNCIKQLIRNQKLECPECRAKHEAPREEKSFSQNKYILIQIKRKAVNGKEEKVTQGYDRCKDHWKELSLFCKEADCQIAICQTCMTKYHKKHDIVELEEQMKQNVIVEVEQVRKNLESKMHLISSVKEDVEKKTERSVNELKRKQEEINRKIDETIKKAEETKREMNLHLDDELSAMNVNVVLLKSIFENIEHKDEISYEEIAGIKETVKEIHENNMKHFSGTRNFRNPTISLDQHIFELLENAVLPEDITIDLTGEINPANVALTNATEVRCSVNWTIATAIHTFMSLTLLSNNRVVVCGDDINSARMVTCHDISVSGMELGGAKLKSDARGIFEVKQAGRLSLAVSCLNEQRIEFRDTENLSHIIHQHSVVQHKPGRLCTVGPSFLLYEDRSKKPCSIHWLDCNEGMPKLLKEKSFSTSLPELWDFVRVGNGADEQIIAIERQNGIHCYNTTTHSMKWSVARNLPGMQQELEAKGVTTDGRGHLFVSDGRGGNRCIQVFSVSDGQYLGCLIKEGEQGLGIPNRMCWHSESQSLVVAHYADDSWCLSMINIEY